MSILPLLNEKIRPTLGVSQLKQARLALFLSTQFVADKMGVSRSAYSQLEKSEEIGTMTLKCLARGAEALGCELVYGIRPKSDEVFSRGIWQEIFVRAMRSRRVARGVVGKRGQILAAVALDVMNNPQFRRQKNWSQRL